MGYETSLMLARNGFHTYATMRKLEGGGSNQMSTILSLYASNDRHLTTKILVLRAGGFASIVFCSQDGNISWSLLPWMLFSHIYHPEPTT